MYCAWRIPAHLRCTQCSILLHLMDICFLTGICLLQISQIQTRLFEVVEPGLVSTSPAFVRNSASHPSGPHGLLAKKTINRAPPNAKHRSLTGYIIKSTCQLVYKLCGIFDSSNVETERIVNIQLDGQFDILGGQFDFHM